MRTLFKTAVVLRDVCELCRVCEQKTDLEQVDISVQVA